jgi:preprotein translocase subunit SecA
LTTALSHLELHIQEPEQVAQSAQARAGRQTMQASHADPSAGEDDRGGGVATLARPPVRRRAAAQIDANNPATWGKVRRNAPCPCGSGKKYKHCHGSVV